LNAISIEGKVTSGTSTGAEFLKLHWVKKQIVKKLGFIPYPGTLNIKLAEESGKLKILLKKARPIEILPRKGFCLGRCFKAHLMGNVECAIVLPEVPNYPVDLIEIIASENLRERLHLKDWDIVEVKVSL
jgi:riboflavin kinase